MGQLDEQLEDIRAARVFQREDLRETMANHLEASAQIRAQLAADAVREAATASGFPSGVPT